MPRFNNGFFNNGVVYTPAKTLEEYQENVSSQADGVNTTFTIRNSIDESSVAMSINGLIYTEADGNISYQEGDTEVTVSFAPQSDDIVVVIYKSFE